MIRFKKKDEEFEFDPVIELFLIFDKLINTMEL